MGIPKKHAPVKLFFGLIASTERHLAAAVERLGRDFSDVDVASKVIPFDMTDYYMNEMGPNLLRQWVATREPIAPSELAGIKHYTNRLEMVYADGERRRVNIDPGYVALSKVVLATTKDYAHRIYVADGIYEEVTLVFRRGIGYEPWPWTYPDYCSETARQFFLEVRQRLGSFYHSERTINK